MLFAVSLLLWAIPAGAETHVFDNLFASIDIPDTYVTLTPDNVASNEDWLQSRDTSSETVANDMDVLQQAYPLLRHKHPIVLRNQDRSLQLVFTKSLQIAALTKNNALPSA